MKLLLDMFYVVCNLTYGAWVGSCWVIGHLRLRGIKAPEAIRSIYHEIKPFYWPVALVTDLLPGFAKDPIVWAANWVNWWNVMASVILWLVCHDMDEDDRWKRRRKAVAEAVKRVGDRLVVVMPEPVHA